MKRVWWTAGLVTQGLFYVAAGINHFWHPRFYLPIMPDYIPAHGEMVALSGACEIAGGLGLLYRPTRRVSAIGLALLLVVFLTVHEWMIRRHGDRFAGISLWSLWARILFQPVLIGWALVYARRDQRS